MKITNLAAILVLSISICARADVKPAVVFGDHMVLQQGMSVPVWGTAGAG
jgi:sialate O-acetylesterase